MKLERATYEAWLLDRIEGRLTPAQVRELDAFLRANPDLPAVTTDLPAVDGVDLEFPMKGILRKDHPPTGAPDAARLDDFLVARREKDLGAEQEKQIDRFLYEHPEAARQAALMALAHVPQDKIAFPAKRSVERHFPPKGMPDAHRLTDFLIADLENDLSAEQRSALQRHLAEHPEALQEQRLVAATRTMPVALPFAGKERLKKREVRVVVLWPRLAAAACFLLLLGAGWWMLRERPADGKELAHEEKHLGHEAIPPADREAPSVVTERTDTEEAGRKAPTAPRTTPEKSPVATASTTTPKTIQPAPKSTLIPEQKHESRGEPSTEPIPEFLPLEEPALAQQVEVPASLPADAEFAGNGAALPGKNPARISANRDGSSQDLGTYLANAVRGKVLEIPQRTAVLDGSDALAFADKAIGAVTGGKGGVEVRHTDGGQRFQLRLGRNFSVSASRGN